jgi:hypothetical protein
VQNFPVSYFYHDLKCSSDLSIIQCIYKPSRATTTDKTWSGLSQVSWAWTLYFQLWKWVEMQKMQTDWTQANRLSTKLFPLWHLFIKSSSIHSMWTIYLLVSSLFASSAFPLIFTIENKVSRHQSKLVIMKHQWEKNKTILGKVALRALQHQPVN